MIERRGSPCHNPAMTPREIVEACIRGDASGWSGLVAEYQPWMLQVARRNLRGHESHAEDVVAETMRKFLENGSALLRTFGEPWNLKAWLAIIVRRAATRVREGLKAESDYSQEIDLLQKVKRPLVEKLLQRLPEPDAELLRLYYLEDQSYEAISAKLGIAVNTIGKRKFRALKHLRDVSRFSSAF